MGKKKQKVRWTSVEEKFFSPNGEDSGSDSTSKTSTRSSFAPQHPSDDVKGHHHYSSARRYGSSHYWSSAPLAPRFERRAAAAAAAASSNGEPTRGAPMTVFYDGECCEAEHLPDGFTKIRSKNLDVLFKRDYYAHKIEFGRSNCSSERGDAEQHSEDDEEEEDAEGGEAGSEDVPRKAKKAGSVSSKAENEEAHQNGGSECGEKVLEANPDTGMQSPVTQTPCYLSSYPYSPNAPPFIPSAQGRPNLFLYSPSSNTMIPCEEIIIPNPVMGPEGPVYPGPSNIYLAFPMENGGPSAGGFITHQFMPPHLQHHHPSIHFDQYGVPYQQQPSYPQGPGSIAGDAASLYQSTSSEGGITEPSSADSTSPHSPPDLSMYSPSNWTNSAAHFDQGAMSPPPYQPHLNSAPSWYHQRANILPASCEPVDKDLLVATSTEEAIVTRVVDLRHHIPGLNPDPRGYSCKRVQKKRRKRKTNPNASAAHHRGSSSSEDHFHQPREEDVVAVAHNADEMKVTKILSRDEAYGEVKPLIRKEEDASPTITVSPPAAEIMEGNKKHNDDDSVAPDSSSCSSFSSSVSSLPCSESGESKMDSISEEKATTKREYDDDIYSSEAVNTAYCDVNVSQEPAAAAAEGAESLVNKCDESVEEIVESKTESAAAIDLVVASSTPQGATTDVTEECNEECNNTAAQEPEATAVPEKTKRRNRRRQKTAKVEQVSNGGTRTEDSLCDTPQPEQSKKLDSIACCKDEVKSEETKPEAFANQSESKPEPKDQDLWESVPSVVLQKPSDGEWETRKRKPRRSNRQRYQTDSYDGEDVQEPEEEASKEEPEEALAVEAPVIVVVDAPEIQVFGSEVADEEDESESTSRRPSNNRRKNKKRFSSHDMADGSRPSTRQVLIQDGLIDFDHSAMRRRSASQDSVAQQVEGAGASERSVDTLFISSIGHGIQLGPLFSGWLGRGKYCPPDRAEEIPLKYRQQPEADEEGEDAKAEGHEEVVVVKTELALD